MTTYAPFNLYPHDQSNSLRRWHARTLLCVYRTHGMEQRWKAELSLLNSLRNQVVTVLFSDFCDVFICFYWTVLVA